MDELDLEKLPALLKLDSGSIADEESRLGQPYPPEQCLSVFRHCGIQMRKTHMLCVELFSKTYNFAADISSLVATIISDIAKYLER